MKSKKFIPFLFILILLLFNTLPAHAAQNKTQSSKKAYQQFLYKNREKNKYFQIVNIGNKNTPVLIIGTGKKKLLMAKHILIIAKYTLFQTTILNRWSLFKIMVDVLSAWKKEGKILSLQRRFWFFFFIYYKEWKSYYPWIF